MAIHAPEVTEIRLALAAMGTRFELVARGDDPGALLAGGEAALERIEEAHRWLTKFETSSLLAHLRRVAPEPVTVDRPTMALFMAARQLTTATQGAFAPLVTGRWDGISIDVASQTISLANPAMAFDFGAIAKGHAVGLAMATLRESGVTAGFVHGGTSSGAGFGPAPWRVALGPERDTPVVSLRDSAFAVSDTFQWRNGRLVPHLLDPTTRQVILVRRRAAVHGPDPRTADAWATALAVRGTRPPALEATYTSWIKDGDSAWRLVR